MFKISKELSLLCVHNFNGNISSRRMHMVYKSSKTFTQCKTMLTTFNYSFILLPTKSKFSGDTLESRLAKLKNKRKNYYMNQYRHSK